MIRKATCGNERHPDGPWHPEARKPSPSQWVLRIKQWYRTLRWGCACPKLGAPEDRVEMVIRIPGLRQQQAAALYLMFDEMRRLGSIGSSRQITFFSDGDGAFRPRPEIVISQHAEAISLWAPFAGKRLGTGSLTIDEDNAAWKMFHVERRRRPAVEDFS